jgi:hypothetical protein
MFLCITTIDHPLAYFWSFFVFFWFVFFVFLMELEHEGFATSLGMNLVVNKILTDTGLPSW